MSTFRLPLIDPRLIYREPADYANPIEPSVRGGDEIAATIAALVGDEGADRRYSSVWT